MRGYTWIRNAPPETVHGSPTALFWGACCCARCELSRSLDLIVGPAKGAAAVSLGWVGLYKHDPRAMAREDGLPPLCHR